MSQTIIQYSHHRKEKGWNVKICFFLFLIILFAPVFIPSTYSIFTRPSYLILFLFALYQFCWLARRKELNSFLKLMFIFSLIQLFYYIFGNRIAYSFDKYGYMTPTPLYSNVIKVFSAFSSVTIAYYLRLKEKIAQKDVIVLFYVFFVYCIVSFFGYAEDVSNESQYEVGVGEITNNVGYFFACILPFFFLVTDKKKRIFFLIIASVFIFISVKRGAILIWMFFLLHYLGWTMKHAKQRMTIILPFLTIFICLGLFFYYYAETHPYIMERFSQTAEGNSSGRDEMYSEMFHFILENTNVMNMLFGFGIGTIINTMGLGSHNDWLEILTSFGLLGGIIYFGLIAYIFKKVVLMKNRNLRSPLFALLYIWIIKSMVSDVFYANLDTVMMFFLIGYLLASENIEKKINKIS